MGTWKFVVDSVPAQILHSSHATSLCSTLKTCLFPHIMGKFLCKLRWSLWIFLIKR